MLSRGFGSASRRVAGFTLVEVSLAMAIMAFGLVVILALIPTGLNMSRRAMDLSVSTQILQRIIGEVQETDWDELTANATGTGSYRAPMRYFDEQGGEVDWDEAAEGERAQVIYFVNTRIVPATPVPTDSGSELNANLATVTVQVAHNPGHRTLDYYPDGHPQQDLIAAPRGMSVMTFPTTVARNE